MKIVEKALNEIKKFGSDELLKENEIHANMVTATTMLIMFAFALFSFVLTYLNIFKAGVYTMLEVVNKCIIFLTIPAVICYSVKGKGWWVKHLLFCSFTIILAITDALLKYNVTLLMVVPVIMAARYYNKRFTISITILTTITFVISIFASMNVGQQDINSYNLIIPSGTTITITSTLRAAISKIQVDETQRLINIFIHFFFPKFFMFVVIAYACTQISSSGRSLIKKQKEISKREERLETEINLAGSIQKGILPSVFPPFPDHPEVDLYAKMTPAREVAGDFYDMFLIDDNHLAICIADVAGKGIPASLFMMTSKTLIKNISGIGIDVNDAFNKINNMLYEGNHSGLFITCWFGVLNLSDGTIEYVNAGHNPPLFYSSKSEKFEYLRIKPDFVLSGLEDTSYKKVVTRIEPGDRIFLYTDGIVEATNKNNKMYGEERLKKFLDSHTDLDAEQTIKALEKDIKSFTGDAEQFDDITMLELVYRSRRDMENVGVYREFKAIERELYNAQNFVNGELAKSNCDMKFLRQIDLVVEEIFINISKYAYGSAQGTCVLTVKSNKKNEVTLIFEDNGVKFNPLEMASPDITLSAKDRQVGGLGIYITKSIMDKVEYKYENNRNVLKITKNIE